MIDERNEPTTVELAYIVPAVCVLLRLCQYAANLVAKPADVCMLLRMCQYAVYQCTSVVYQCTSVVYQCNAPMYWCHCTSVPVYQCTSVTHQCTGVIVPVYQRASVM